MEPKTADPYPNPNPNPEQITKLDEAHGALELKDKEAQKEEVEREGKERRAVRVEASG